MNVTFSLNTRNELKLEYEGRTTRRTVINMTNHTYWNMSGDFKTKIYPLLLQVNADTYLPVVDMIPTGERASVEGTPFDFRAPTQCEQALAICCDRIRPGMLSVYTPDRADALELMQEAVRRRPVEAVDDPKAEQMSYFQMDGEDFRPRAYYGTSAIYRV